MSETAAANGANEPKGGSIIAGRYQIDRLIARGGMASVYLAHQVKLNRPVALKILTPPPDAEDSAAFEERFRLEAETLAALDHPNIVILHDFGELDDGRFFLAMEFVDGPRLSDILRDGPMECERALQLVTQVAAALRYAHKRGVVHRDLKPSNLLVKTDDDGAEQVKVVDFGLVKLTEADQSITRAGLILGSPHCMSPEQVKGLEVDHRADIYAIGVLLFRVLTGQYPFHGANSAATMIQHLNHDIPTFYSVAPELVVPDGLEAVVRKCLAKTASERYQDTSELLADLATCMAQPPDPFRSTSSTAASLVRQVPAAEVATAPPAPARSSVAGKLWIPFALAAVLFALVFVAVVSVVATSLFTTGRGAVQPTEQLPNMVVETEPAPRPVPTEDPIDEGTPGDGTPEDPGPADPEPDAVPEPAPPEPAPVPEPVAPKPEPVAPKPAPTPKPTPKPAPTANPAPAPAPQPAPVQPAPQPAPSPAPEPKNPEGYMGLPDDFK
ncbi:MAG: serine/threonine protein kinase [Alphaproteobacteria bacterium]|nr:serine/threonine protein kinase [Alphaproteobacteria bacterium]